MSNIGVVVLAAGGSSRMGRPKQLLPYVRITDSVPPGGEQERYLNSTLIENAITTALESKCDPIICILGAHAEEILSLLKDKYPVRCLINAAWQEGLSSSIKTGIEYVQSNLPQLTGVVLMTCDQPFVSTQTINALVDRFAESGKAIVASSYARTLGVPALFSSGCFPELLALTGDKGAKSLITRSQGEVASIDFPEGKIDLDYDDEYEELIGTIVKSPIRD